MRVAFEDVARGRQSGEVTLLPDPPRRRRYFTVISVDDHLVEPPHTFEGRVPAAFVDRAPRVVDGPDGGQAWLYDGELLFNIGINAVVGRPPNEWSSDPTRFEHMRRGSWDIDARLRDMDLDGVYASLCFPSFLAGFGGGRLQTVTSDHALALAVVKAWNDWVHEEWTGKYPERMIPLGITWLHDPVVGAEEVRRNAARGFRALAFPENPEPYGWPSIHTRHWDPIFEACEETGTVLCLHVGSAGAMPTSFSDGPMDVPATLFGTYACTYAVEWLFSLVALRFPEIKICISEGGIGWVAGLMDKLDHNSRYDDMLGTWKTIDIRPTELLKRNFWFCALDDPSSWPVRHRIGVDNILVESDYPHGDGSWPNTQELLRRQLGDLSSEEIAMVTWKNASEMLSFPVPAAVVNDPESF